MNKTFQTLTRTFRACGRAIATVATSGAEWLREASWQRILGFSLLGAFLLAIVPTALMLFAIFMLVKLAIQALRKPAEPLRLTYEPTDGGQA